ncbi:MAG: hypothetical protein JWO75_5208 [Actinomycetia bacterium]|nr:hypothetical protein [Actinomycetes bacterium]
MPLVLGDQGYHAGTRVSESHRGREAHVLRPDHERTTRQPLPAEVDALLKLAGGEHARRPVAGHQPRRPGPLPAPGGEQHRRRVHFLNARRAGHDRRQRSAVSPQFGDGAPGPQLRSRPDRGPCQDPRVRRAGQHPVQVAQPVPGVPAVPGNAARLCLPVSDQDTRHAEAAQLGGGRQPGRPGPDDEDVNVHDVPRSCSSCPRRRISRTPPRRSRTPGSGRSSHGSAAGARPAPRAGCRRPARRGSRPG